MVKRKKKKVKVPFWKKFGPEANHIFDHAGHIIDNSSVDQLAEALLYLGTAAWGVQVTGDLRGALIGPIGLKLASSMNVIAGGAGVAILTTLGLLTISKISPTAVMPTWAFWPQPPIWIP